MYLKYILFIVFFILFINIVTFKKLKRTESYVNNSIYESLPNRKETFQDSTVPSKAKKCVLDIQKYSAALVSLASINNNICLETKYLQDVSLISSLNKQEKDIKRAFEDKNDFLYKDIPDSITDSILPKDNKYGLYKKGGYYGSVVEATHYNRSLWPNNDNQKTLFDNCYHGITGGSITNPNLKECIEHINKPHFWYLVNRGRNGTLIEESKRLTEIYSVGINMFDSGQNKGGCNNRTNSCIYYGVTKKGYNPSINFQSTFIKRKEYTYKRGLVSASFKFIVPKKRKGFQDFMCSNNTNEVKTNEECLRLYNEMNNKNIQYIYKENSHGDALTEIRSSLKMYPGCRYIETQNNKKYITFIETLDTVKHVFENKDILEFNKHKFKILPRKLCTNKVEDTFKITENNDLMIFLKKRLKNKNITSPAPFIGLFINSDTHCENLKKITDIIKGKKFTHIDYAKDEVGRQIIYNELELEGITELPVIILYKEDKKYRYISSDLNINDKDTIINAPSNKELFDKWMEDPGKPHGKCFKNNKGIDYRGNVNKTLSGKECMNWKTELKSDNSSGYYFSVDPRKPSGLSDWSWFMFGAKDGIQDHNKCRNPGGTESNPWCYTKTKGSGPRWELCDITNIQDEDGWGRCTE